MSISRLLPRQLSIGGIFAAIAAFRIAVQVCVQCHLLDLVAVPAGQKMEYLFGYIKHHQGITSTTDVARVSSSVAEKRSLD